MPAASNGTPPDSAQVGMATELSKHTPLLGAILAQLRTDVIQVAVGDVVRREMVMDNFPVAGSKRVIVRRTGNGWDNQAVPTAPGVLLLGANEGRLGGSIGNTGANAIILYLSDAQREGVLALYLAAGASWDFRLGNLLWVGHVWATAQTSASTVCGGEV